MYIGPRGRRIYEMGKVKVLLCYTTCRVRTVGGPTCSARIWEMIAFEHTAAGLNVV